jgi:hypothetical protein
LGKEGIPPNESICFTERWQYLREMKIPQAVAWVLLMSALTAGAAQPSKTTTSGKTQTEITDLLHEFLSKVDQMEMHDRFWADDLIYTGASGAVKTKADILKSFRDDAAKSGQSHLKANKETYDAEQITVRQYGDPAILNFRLVRHTPGMPDENFRNTGTFVKRDGKWQAVVWQATKVAPPETKESK